MQRRRTRRLSRSDLPMLPPDAPLPPENLTLKCWQLQGGQDFVPLPGGIPGKEWVGAGDVRWVDAQTADAAALGQLLQNLGTPPTIIEFATDFDARISDAHAERDAAWLRIPVPAAISNEEHRFINVIALPSVIITHHRRPMPRLEQLEQMLVHAMPDGSSSTGLVLEVLEEFSAEDLRLYVRVRHDVDELARALDEQPGSVTLEQISDLMRRVDLLSTVCEDHLLAVSLLPQLESQAFRTAVDRDHLNEVTKTLERYQFGLKRLERRLEGLRALYAASLQENANQRLRVLTVMSTIFLPMTLLASIYGMNFEHMPELKSRIGYPSVLVAMVAIAGVQLWFYRRKGWLD
ncbi:MAG: CorA family divalent cation transporter [Gemmatimonadaceae bacterium]|nr:CorA family divalent cation transporter [Gemmatimonadaceae bacterium]